MKFYINSGSLETVIDRPDEDTAVRDALVRFVNDRVDGNLSMLTRSSMRGFESWHGNERVHLTYDILYELGIADKVTLDYDNISSIEFNDENV